MSLESCLWLTAKILVEWVIFADVTLEICMDLATLYVTCLWHWLVSVLGTVHRWWSFPPFFCFYWQLLQSHGRRCEVADCLGSDGTMRNYVVQLGVPICRTAAPWWTEICHSGCQIPHSMISSFGWLHVDCYQKHSLRIYGIQFFYLWNSIWHMSSCWSASSCKSFMASLNGRWYDEGLYLPLILFTIMWGCHLTSLACLAPLAIQEDASFDSREVCHHFVLSAMSCFATGTVFAQWLFAVDIQFLCSSIIGVSHRSCLFSICL